MIDVIIPVYNTPIVDLKRCLDSVNEQSFDDYQVIIIDDGSNKEIKNYLDKYVLDKNNFIVKHIKNGGVSNARNTGLKLSKSEYITFVDSDDTIEKDFLKEAYDLIVKNDLDIIIGGYNELINNKVVRTRSCVGGLHIYEKDNLNLFFDKLLSAKLRKDNKEISSAPVGRIYTRLYKKSVIHDIKFNSNIKMSEDTLFMIDCMSKVSRIGLVDKIWYNYYQNPYSISNNKEKEKLARNILDFVKEIYKQSKNENNTEIRNAYYMRIFKATLEINRLLTVVGNNELKIEINKLKYIKDSIVNLDISKYIDINEKEMLFYQMFKIK